MIILSFILFNTLSTNLKTANIVMLFQLAGLLENKKLMIMRQKRNGFASTKFDV